MGLAIIDALVDELEIGARAGVPGTLVLMRKRSAGLTRVTRRRSGGPRGRDPRASGHAAPAARVGHASALALSLLTRVEIFSTRRSASFSSLRFASSRSTARSSPIAFAIRRSPS